MAAALYPISLLLPAIDNEELILTPNNRLKNKILEAYGQYSLSKDQPIWQSPRIFALSEWLEEQWQVLLDKGYPGCRASIATSFHRELLWQKIIGQSPETPVLLNVDGLSRHADSAYRTLELWELSISDLEEYSQEDNQAFTQWCETFSHKMQQLDLITSEASYSVIAHAFQNKILHQENLIHLVGFDDLPPLILSVISAAGIQHKHADNLHVDKPVIFRTQTTDLEEEIRSAALWSRQTLMAEQGAAIGIIVPQLGQIRDLVERIFTEVYEARYYLPDTPRYTLPFNFSAGTPLGNTALIHDTLQLLGLNRNNWPLESICQVLFSPFFSKGDAELSTRSSLVNKLRSLGKLSIRGADLRYYSQIIEEQELARQADSFTQLSLIPEEPLNTDSPDTYSTQKTVSLSARFQYIESLRKQSSRKQLPGKWTHFFITQLDILGWPGSRRLDSNEYQQVSQWYQLLEKFASLDTTGVKLTLSEALEAIQKLAGSTHFQAQVPSSPIQILGMLEGAGLQFTHCWVLGLDQQNWPPAAAPHPLLPIELQRNYGMPHATAERELIYAQSLTKGYQHCAQEIIFSSAEFEEETALMPSNLIIDIPFVNIQHLITRRQSILQSYYQKLAKQQKLQWVDCSQGPPVTTAQPFTGGSSVLQQQAVCPFNAFAIHRLGAKTVHPPQLGLSAIERGTVLHNALAEIWLTLKNQQTLISSSTDEIEQLIRTKVMNALQFVNRNRPDLGKKYLEIESDRQTRLITQWLEAEKLRPEFNVRSIEETITVSLHNLTLKLRMDRIDELVSGEKILIDYKTGQPKLQQWEGERPEEPQLPLYAISQADQVQAISFGIVNARHIQFSGLGDLSLSHPGITALNDSRQINLPDNWNDAIQYWSLNLHTLASEFIQGHCQVTYYHPNSERFYSEYAPLNRVSEQAYLNQLQFETTDSNNHP